MRRTTRILLCILAVLVSFVLIFGCVISQPILSHNTPSIKSVKPDKLRKHVSVLSEQYYPRSYENSDNLSKCAAYIRKQFSRTGGHVTSQLYDGLGHSFENIILLLPGTNVARIVVGAHYDTCDDTPGADDNASGVAGLIELAHLLGDADLEHTIELVAYSTEEPPF